jgi:hypothetical protein
MGLVRAPKSGPTHLSGDLIASMGGRAQGTVPVLPNNKYSTASQQISSLRSASLAEGTEHSQAKKEENVSGKAKTWIWPLCERCPYQHVENARNERSEIVIFRECVTNLLLKNTQTK